MEKGVNKEGMFARRTRHPNQCSGIYPKAFIIPSSSPGYPIPAVSEPTWAEWLHHPHLLGGDGDKKWEKGGTALGKLGNTLPGALGAHPYSQGGEEIQRPWRHLRNK